jgi:Fe-S cluster assembly ATP-binding protein
MSYSEKGAGMHDTFEIQNLHVRIEEREILKGVNLVVKKGEVHALMGPNGSGKSTLAYALMGHPKYTVTEGKILMKGQSLLGMEPDARARLGLFLAFQYPCEVPGVRMSNFLRLAVNARVGKETDVMEFYDKIEKTMKHLDMGEQFVKRYVNEGFSGGEKKRNEILQMMMLQPEFAVLDETDSGLDIDALRIVSKGVNELRGPDLGILIITHYERILRYITPDFVHILVDGRIVKSGGADLAAHLEEHGYDWIIKESETKA